jgi:O-antigen/teichoic acid export membrane protein
MLIAIDQPRIANWAVGIGVATGLASIVSLGRFFGVPGLAAAVIVTQLTVLGSLVALGRAKTIEV